MHQPRKGQSGTSDNFTSDNIDLIEALNCSLG